MGSAEKRLDDCVQDAHIAVEQQQREEPDDRRAEHVRKERHRADIFMAGNFQIQKIRRKKLDRRNDKQNAEQIDQVVLQRIEEYAGHPLAEEQIAEILKADKFHRADSAPFEEAVKDRACDRNNHKQCIQKQSGRDKPDIGAVLPRLIT